MKIKVAKWYKPSTHICLQPHNRLLLGQFRLTLASVTGAQPWLYRIMNYLCCVDKKSIASKTTVGLHIQQLYNG